MRMCLTSHRSDSKHWEGDHLPDLMTAQTEETKAALHASTQIGRLTTLAFFCLPVQITASILGTNLKAFRSGSLRTKSFISTLCMLVTLTIFLAIFFSKEVIEVFARGLAIWQHSRRVAALYVPLGIPHPASMNDAVWKCGIEWNILLFRGVHLTEHSGEGQGCKTDEGRAA